MTVGESPAGDDVPAGSSNRLLIVNADDYGMTSGISNGIIAAFERGVVTSTSALTVAAAFDRHAQQLVDSGIPTGAHLAAVGEDRPLLSAREIPTLVDRDGRFPLRWREFVQRAATGRVDPSDLTREFRAQLTRLRDLGVNVTHLDSHQNIHLWPSVARVVVDLAVTDGVGAVRLPTARGSSPTAIAVRRLTGHLRRLAARAGRAFPDESSGIEGQPAPHDAGLRSSLDRLDATGAASAEIVMHLAVDPDPERAAYPSRYAWAAQFAAAIDPAARARIDELGFRLGSFADLRPAARTAVGR
jgi:predicted glycoside hydrolase/deacetylase ChbG (UPF0249 family)